MTHHGYSTAQLVRLWWTIILMFVLLMSLISLFALFAWYCIIHRSITWHMIIVIMLYAMIKQHFSYFSDKCHDFNKLCITCLMSFIEKDKIISHDSQISYEFHMKFQWISISIFHWTAVSSLEYAVKRSDVQIASNLACSNAVLLFYTLPHEVLYKITDCQRLAVWQFENKNLKCS